MSVRSVRRGYGQVLAKPRYSDHLDVLVALATYLALTPKTSRTIPWLAKDLSLPEAAVRTALEGFPGIFRRSRRPSSVGEHFYTLHARFALRSTDADSETQALVELRSDLLSTVLQFVTQQAAQESSFEQFKHQQLQTLRATWVAAGAAIVAAIMAAVATVISK
jgi:hypothetical protein